jgi:uncharacterized protein YdhG (YjbR/CyaY superfamily)
MKTRPDVAKDIDAYIAAAPEHTRAILQKVRRAVAKAAPGAQEAIRYAIPTFTLQRNLVHFAGYDKHIGLYRETNRRSSRTRAGRAPCVFRSASPFRTR